MDLATVDAYEPAVRASLARWRDGDAWLVGGTWLFSEPQPHVRRLLDLHAFGWPSLTVTDAGLEIAATCTIAELAGFTPPQRWTAGPVLRQCCEALLGSFKVWNEATVGGNVCCALPAGPMTSLGASLDGVATVWRRDGSAAAVPMAAFVTGNGVNALAPGELLRAVSLPERVLRARTAFRSFSKTTLGRSAVVVIGYRSGDGATAITVSAAVTHPCPLRFDRPPTAAELTDALLAAAPAYFDDPHGTAAWRAHLTERLAEEVRSELAVEVAPA